MEIKTLLFDLGNVLFDFSHPKMCQQMADLFETSSEKMNEVLFDNKFAAEFERGQLTEAEFHHLLEETFQRRCQIEDLRRACGDIFIPKPQMTKIVRELNNAGIRLVLLSNTCQTHIEWIRNTSDLLADFDHLVLSYEVGASKPEPAIFQAALQQIQCEPQHCLYTDDIADYIAVGKEHGLNAELFEGENKFLQTLASYGISIPF